MRHTAKSVRYHLMSDNQFVLSCLMILNARERGFLDKDAKDLKFLAKKVKTKKRLTASDWVIARKRLVNYVDTLAFAINDINRKARS